jgi:hypothetical protein
VLGTAQTLKHCVRDASFIQNCLNLSDLKQPWFLMFGLSISKRGRGWEWRVDDSAGNAVMRGWESKRIRARYLAEHALFLLLMATRAREFDRGDRL